MKRLLPALVLLTLLLGACSGGGATTQAVTPADASSPTVQAGPAREAVISEVENTVSARAGAEGELVPATNGMSISAGGSVETGDGGRAKVELRPDGTVLRVGPNSSFTIPVLTEENGQPKTKLELAFGKVFVLLQGGTLDVETPSGVASVQGSLLSVEYDQEKGRIEATCLEGHCALEDEDGDEVELTEGESSYIEGDEDPSDPEMIDREDIEDWLEENPDLSEYLDEMPDPEDYPEDFDTEDGDGDETFEEDYTEESTDEEDGGYEEEGGGEGGESDGGEGGE
jgi:hypothetical protein